MKLTTLIVVFGGLALAAGNSVFAQSLTWLTPKGQVIVNSTCISHGASKHGGPETCYFRAITHAPDEIEQCRSDGGTARYLDSIETAYVCQFPFADAGKACTKSTDCDVACDADTQQCRAFSSLGRVLDKGGRTVEMVE